MYIICYCWCNQLCKTGVAPIYTREYVRPNTCLCNRIRVCSTEYEFLYTEVTCNIVYQNTYPNVLLYPNIVFSYLNTGLCSFVLALARVASCKIKSDIFKIRTWVRSINPPSPETFSSISSTKSEQNCHGHIYFYIVVKF